VPEQPLGGDAPVASNFLFEVDGVEIGAFREVSGLQAMRSLLACHPDLDAVFCNTDVLAIGALFACIGRGIPVPEGFGIAGFNDFDYMEAAEPSLSSVRTHRWRCGNAAMRAVREMLGGAPLAEPVVDLGFDIMQRRSTDRTGCAGPAAHAAQAGQGIDITS